MGGMHSVHYKVMTAAGDEHYITLRFHSLTWWYQVEVDLEPVVTSRKQFGAPGKFDFVVGMDSFRFLFDYDNKPYVLYNLAEGKLTEIPNLLTKPSPYRDPKIEIMVLDYDFDAKSAAEADPVAVYKIRVTLGEADPYIIRRRFRDMAQLNDNVCASFSGNVLYSNLPDFPSRLPKLLTDHTDPEFLRDRCETLNEYFLKLPKVPYVLENPDFQNFLRPDA